MSEAYTEVRAVKTNLARAVAASLTFNRFSRWSGSRRAAKASTEKAAVSGTKEI